jgi:hypothetical protein
MGHATWGGTVTEREISVTDLAGLADRLESLEGLDESDRELLAGVFELAGTAAADQQNDVQGFGTEIQDGLAAHGIIVVCREPGFGFQAAFNLGFGNPGGAQMGAQPHM